VGTVLNTEHEVVALAGDLVEENQLLGSVVAVLDAEHGALLVAPAGDLVEEHELLYVARRGYPPRQIGLINYD
jgi:hypothetical protein